MKVTVKLSLKFWGPLALLFCLSQDAGKGDTVTSAGVVAVVDEAAIIETPYTVSGTGTVRYATITTMILGGKPSGSSMMSVAHRYLRA